SRLSSLSFPSSLARRDPPSCPTRRSSDLAYQRHLRRARLVYLRRRRALLDALATALPGVRVGGVAAGLHLVVPVPGPAAEAAAVDRKSTRLNSSHVKSSYAVFCLKKKKRH